MSYSCNFVKYVRCNIPGPGCHLEQFEEQIEGCQCRTSCDTSGKSSMCSCVTSFGASYKDDRMIKYSSRDSHSAPVFECNSTCKCPIWCKNRVVQRGLRFQMSVCWDDSKGMCLRTLDPIPENSYVCEYAGEVISTEEACKRFKSLTKDDMNYIFVLKEHFASQTLYTYIDPLYTGNIGRFLNHSCDPNLFMVAVRVNNMIPKLCLFARREISPGEELTYDYSGLAATTDVVSQTEVSSSHVSGTEDISRNITDVSGENAVCDLEVKEIVETKRRPCHCLSASCRGFLPSDNSLFP
ncbi:hypothetical protein CHS0354_008297 [Potamilus streckersoni]|uniref:Histone-lysine N-methyltransferase SETMAR n=1 Tax=Potamilus streckersoni TaxID=2493646 RepID=A0AAE0VHB2_9BIVA|nr:hypothetical protein CHS0354_008297 [Potamilus streckersoni]